ncbi:phospholipase DDHD2-like isoform X2 [Daktulosphaira vitifoliae]|uniref:phospholipase DDHD2-like isoform X2 n=1 Tax=Daktulosphaira vitifoliae TaxID=58002 RepID=UPI0021AA9AD0|nr:phospholipase DDHD2-like isoform X2 [Daktulosphaira vitifoliae]
MEETHSKNSLNKDSNNQFQESCSYSTPRSFEEPNNLIVTGKQRIHYLNKNDGVLNLSEYNLHELPTQYSNIEQNQYHVDNTFDKQSNLSKLSYSAQNFSSQTETLVDEKNNDISENTSEFSKMTAVSYIPVKWHWFYCKYPNKNVWVPFSQKDSDVLEKHYLFETKKEIVVSTNGTRFDVYLKERIRKSVYWDCESTEVRRCSWFFRNRRGSNFIPYDEHKTVRLEENYKIACETNKWGKRISINCQEEVVLHSPTAFIQYGVSIISLNCDEEVQPEIQTSQITNVPSLKQCIVKRGLEEFVIPNDEPSKVDHLMFIVHGIGSYCDLKMRPIYEVVDDFRSLAQQLTQSHFKTSLNSNKIGRIEVLPVSWHEALHSESIDRKLKSITLPSIPRLRNFSNDTILDVLFYTSPTFCQTIVNAVGNEMNRMYSLYLTRNTNFNGHVSIGGHSLGSLISFDLLWNQCPSSPGEKFLNSDQEKSSNFEMEKAELSRGVSYVTLGKAGTGQPYITYPQLNFQLDCFFGFGSPIGMFVTVRGIESLGENFKFPTCPGFFNIFHPYDPVAYRIEPLINPEFENIPPVQIPHHKGRKRMHLELKDTMTHVGAALKNHLVQSVKTTWNTFYQLAMFSKMPSESIEYKPRKVFNQEITSQATSSNKESLNSLKVKAGHLNKGNRVDYVLQEAPLESFNEYLFAVGSHLCYWESEDTILLVLKEIYSALGVSPDNQVQHAMLPFDISDENSSNFSSSMQFEEPPGFNLSFSSLSPIFDEKHDK